MVPFLGVIYHVHLNNAIGAAAAVPVVVPELTDDEAIAAFPVAKLIKLDELISNPRYVSLNLAVCQSDIVNFFNL